MQGTHAQYSIYLNLSPWFLTKRWIISFGREVHGGNEVGKLDRLMGLLLYVRMDYLFFPQKSDRSHLPQSRPIPHLLFCVFFLFRLLPNQPIISGNRRWKRLGKKTEDVVQQDSFAKGPIFEFKVSDGKAQKTNPCAYKHGNSKYFSCQPLAASWSRATRPISLDKL